MSTVETIQRLIDLYSGWDVRARTADLTVPDVLDALHAAKQAMTQDYQTIDVLFSGLGQALSFLELEDLNGRGIRVGEWIQRGDGLIALRLDVKKTKETTMNNQPRRHV